MEDLNSYISGLTRQAEKLASAQIALVKENQALRAEKESLSKVITDQKNVLNQLEEQNKVVKIAKAVTDDAGDRAEQRKRLNELVREIDKCIALLNN